MPCRVDLCPHCADYNCPGFDGGACINAGKKPIAKLAPASSGHKVICSTCNIAACGGYMEGVLCDTQKAHDAFDTSGALCDLLTMLEDKHPHAYGRVDKKTLEWWEYHQRNEQDKIKREALSKLSPEEKKALGLS